MNPQFYELLVERLLAGGAHDVWLTPVQMKKGRPGVVVSAIAPATMAGAVESLIFANTPTLGVRRTAVSRTKAARGFVTVTTQWGDVRLKLRERDGQVVNAVPEYDDVAGISRMVGVPVAVVWDEAHRLGDQFVGQGWTDMGSSFRTGSVDSDEKRN